MVKKKKCPKPIVLLRGHHLHLLYCYVFLNLKKQICDQNKHKFTKRSFNNVFDILERIKQGECRVKLVEGLDSLCQLCDDKTEERCFKFDPDNSNAISGDRAYICLLNFKKDRVYPAKLLLSKLEKEYVALAKRLTK